MHNAQGGQTKHIEQIINRHLRLQVIVRHNSENILVSSGGHRDGGGRGSDHENMILRIDVHGRNGSAGAHGADHADQIRIGRELLGNGHTRRTFALIITAFDYNLPSIQITKGLNATVAPLSMSCP
jgi:hypothetical protein